MCDRIELARGEQLGHRAALDDIEFLENKSRSRLEAVEPCVLQPHVVVVVQIVDPHDMVAAVEQTVRQRRSNKARGSGNENFHLRTVPLSVRPTTLAYARSVPCTCLYPRGFRLCQRQLSRHMSSSPWAAFHPSRLSASEGSAYDSATSPGRRATCSIEILRPLARSNACTASSTEIPLPVPRFTVNPRGSRRRVSRAARCPRARSTT